MSKFVLALSGAISAVNGIQVERVGANDFDLHQRSLLNWLAQLLAAEDARLAAAEARFAKEWPVEEQCAKFSNELWYPGDDECEAMQRTFWFGGTDDYNLWKDASGTILWNVADGGSSSTGSAFTIACEKFLDEGTPQACMYYKNNKWKIDAASASLSSGANGNLQDEVRVI